MFSQRDKAATQKAIARIGFLGLGTQQMRDKMIFDGWNVETRGGKQYINIENTEYRVLDGTVTSFNEPIASIGASLGREIILFDPNSKPLDDTYQEIKKIIHSEQAVGDINKINKLVMSHLQEILGAKEHGSSLGYVVDQFCQKEGFETYQGKPLIPLDEFLRNKIGVCRHHGMLLAYLFDRLQTDGLIPKGEIHHARENTVRGRHVWLMYQPEKTDDFFLVDSMWYKAGNVNDERTKKYLMSQGYGNAALGGFRSFQAQALFCFH